MPIRAGGALGAMFGGPRDLDRDQALSRKKPANSSIRSSREAARGRADHDLAISEQCSELGDMDCARRLDIPQSAVIPPSTNSKAPVT
jgi:hypothetical protein